MFLSIDLYEKIWIIRNGGVILHSLSEISPAGLWKGRLSRVLERLNNVKLENKIWRSGLFALTLQSLSPERQANIESLTIKDEQYKSRGRCGIYVRRKFFNSVNFDQAQ